jgi:micrococcal nuclease
VGVSRVFSLGLSGLIASFALCGQASAETFSGVVTRGWDGDTVWVRPDGSTGKPVKLRLLGLDAPESCQAGGAQATAALKSRVLGQHVHVQAKATDAYQRRVVSLFVAGDDVGAWLVSQGHAWSYGYRYHPGRYAAQEHAARASGRGLFADPRAVEPRVFRKQHGKCPMPFSSRRPRA